MFLRLAVQGCFTLVLAAAGLVWGFCILPISEASDDFGYFESHLLQSETFNPKTLALKLSSPAAQVVGDCDTHAQTALLLIEMRLAQAALRAGGVEEFDRRTESLASRSSRVLGCAPRQSLIWLVAFSLEVMHGRLNEHTFNLLAMSYETSPNEAWVSIRRISVALPFLLIASPLLRAEILSEFQRLIRDGFLDVAARSYLGASEPIRSLLQTQIEQLDRPRQKAFSDVLQKLGS
jgi:hypothetical protein